MDGRLTSGAGNFVVHACCHVFDELLAQEELRLLHRFDGASADVRRYKQVRIASRVLYERMPRHTGGLFLTQNVDCGAGDVAGAQRGE